MIIDGHVHVWRRPMLPDSMLRAYLEPWLALEGLIDMKIDIEQDWPMSEVDCEWLVRSMDSARVDKAVVLPLDFGLVETPKIGVEEYNDWVFNAAVTYQDRIIPFIGVDPNRGEKAVELVEKYTRKFDAKGIKVYPGTGWFPNDERLHGFWDLVMNHDLLVVTHAGASWGPLDEKYNHPALFREVLENWPELNLVIAHLGGKFRPETYELAKDFPNVYTDCSALQGWLPSEPAVVIDRLKEAVAKMSGRVIFGSDWPLFDLSYPYSNWMPFVRDEKWGTETQKEQVLGGTMRRLLGL
jgi:predicted TIM-barrel fold metal-dependent hydrolase